MYKKTKQLSVFCLFAILHMNLHWRKKKSVIRCHTPSNWRPKLTCECANECRFTQRRAASPLSHTLTQPSLKGFVSLHPEVLGDPRGLWGHKYSY